MVGYGEGGRRSRPCEPGLAGWYGLAARAIQVCDVQENDFLLGTARSQAWLAGLAWPRAINIRYVQEERVPVGNRPL